MHARGSGTKADPWVLQTPPRSSEYQLYRDPDADPPALVCVVGKTTLSYRLRCIEDLHAMLVAHGDWMELGSADEQKPAKEGTGEAWARPARHPPRRLVRIAEGTARPFRHVRSAPPRAPRPDRAGAQPQKQPRPGPLT